MVVAAPAGMNNEGGSGAADVGVGTPGLRDGKLSDGQFAMEITATGKVHFQMVGVNNIFHIDVGATGSMQKVHGLAGNIGFQMLVAPMPPMKTMILHINSQDTISDFDPYPVANVQIAGTDRHGFFITLAEVQIDTTGYLDAMETLGRAFLGVLIIDHLPILGNGGE